MRVTNHTEAAVRELLQTKINQRQITQADAQHMGSEGFRAIAQTLGNWRHREATDKQIADAIQRRMNAAKLHRHQAKTQAAYARALRELVIAQMYEVIWAGMLRDVAAYQNA
jgi:hypothetical protein